MKKVMKKYWFKFLDQTGTEIELGFTTYSIEKAREYAMNESRNYGFKLLEYLGWTEIGETRNG